ncbi:hypothetical protein NFI96_016909, partial [Prochilodus magdalenae]
VEEIEALSAIYGEEWCVIDEASRIFCIKISDDINEPKWSACLQIILPEDYPSSAPPIYQINAGWLRGPDRIKLSNSLEELYLENVGESILYLWVEKIREFLIERSQYANTGKDAECDCGFINIYSSQNCSTKACKPYGEAATVADMQRAVVSSMHHAVSAAPLADAAPPRTLSLTLSLTPRHRHQRLQWCRTRLSWSDSEWQRVIFSDESRFSLGGDAQRTRVWRHRGQHQDERFVVTRPEGLVSLHLHPYRTICRNCGDETVLIADGVAQGSKCGVVPDCHGVTQNGSGSSSVTSPALVLVETPNESVCGGTVVSTEMNCLLSRVTYPEGLVSLHPNPYPYEVEGPEPGIAVTTEEEDGDWDEGDVPDYSSLKLNTEQAHLFSSSSAGNWLFLFLPYMVPVQRVIDQLYENKKIASATHNVYAYRIYCEDKSTFLQDCEDDGETAAGGRLLHLLQILDVRNVLVVVSRWYGGILLGPDRFKHINNCARNILVQEGYTEVMVRLFCMLHKTFPADGAVGVEVGRHQAFRTCDNKPFVLVLTTVPPHTDSLGVSTKTKAGLVTEDDLLSF